jgi:hypothetical protein
MGVHSREEEDDRLGWLDWVQVGVIVQLVPLVPPFVMERIVFVVEDIIAFLLFLLYHLPQPRGPLL